MKTNTLDPNESMRWSGHDALTEWARWGQDRGPTWPKENILWRAAHGGSRGKTKESDMPVAVATTDRSVGKLPPIIRSVVHCYYIDFRIKPKQHAIELGISRTDFFDKLKIGQYLVGIQIE